MKFAQGGSGSVWVRGLWLLAVAIVWSFWFLLYGLAFAWVNELLTRIGPLAADNGMLARPLEIALQVLLAAAFGFAGVALLQLARAPRFMWAFAAGLSVAFSLGTVVLWATSAAAESAKGGASTYLLYALVGAAMAAGCWATSKFVRPELKAAPASSSDSATEDVA